jgi:hypothetical protein
MTTLSHRGPRVNLYALGAILLTLVQVTAAETLTVTSPVSIGAGDTTHEGWDIVVDAGGVLTIDGFHHFANLEVIHGGLVRHGALSALRLNVGWGTGEGRLFVDAQSSVDVSGLGYESAEGPGAGLDGILAGGGAGHGGGGGNSSEGAAGGTTYGNVSHPLTPGSGGGVGGLAMGGAGGGVICLDVEGTVRIDGALRADGTWGRDGGDETWIFDNGGGGGSGGSIEIRCAVLTGTGRISAAGGNNRNQVPIGGGGGGGHIAIFATTRLLPDNFVLAPGGYGFQNGQEGTVIFGTTIVKPDGTGEYPTIQRAADSVDDYTVVLLADGVFTGDGNRDVDPHGKNLVFASISGDPQNCVIDCQGSPQEPHRAFHFHNQEQVQTRIVGLTITGGDVSGLADGRGGGIWLETGSNIVLENIIFIANRAATGGGGLHHDIHSSSRINGAVFSLNASESGGGGLHYSHGSQGSLDQTILIQNQSVDGGGLYFGGGGTVQLRTCTIVGNDGPGLFLGADANVSIERSIIAFNTQEAIACAADLAITLHCSDLWGNQGGDYVDCLEGHEGLDGGGESEIGNNLLADPLFTDWQNGDLTFLPGSPALPENNPCGVLLGADLDFAWSLRNRWRATGVSPLDPAIPGIRLQPNRPNPFNPATTITFTLAQSADARLAIYSLDGRCIARLVDGVLAAGTHVSLWTGRDDAGHEVPSGVYLCRLESGDQIATRRINLLK